MPLGFIGKGLVSNEALIEQAQDSTAPAAANAFPIVMTIISLFVSATNLFAGIFGGNFSLHSLIECVLPALMTRCANSVCKQVKG